MLAKALHKEVLVETFILVETQTLSLHHHGGWWCHACGHFNLNGGWYHGGHYQSRYQDVVYCAEFRGGILSEEGCYADPACVVVTVPSVLPMVFLSSCGHTPHTMSVLPIWIWSGSLLEPSILFTLLLLLQVFQDETVQVIQETALT